MKALMRKCKRFSFELSLGAPSADTLTAQKSRVRLSRIWLARRRPARRRDSKLVVDQIERQKRLGQQPLKRVIQPRAAVENRSSHK